MGLVEQSGDSYRIVSPTVDIDPGSIDFAIRNYHREHLERAREAIDGDPYEDREFSSLTLPLCPADYPALRERLKEFRRQLLVDFPSSKTGRSHVVAVNFQTIVLTDGLLTKTKKKEKLK